MRAITAAALSLLFALPAVPQEKLVESIEVRVNNVDVVVRDKQGHPVYGLTKDDFEIWDNGKKQEVTNLYEVRPEALSATVAQTASNLPETAPGTPAAVNEAPDELRQRKLIVFIDNFSLPPMRRNEIFKSLEKFVDTHMRPGDQTMLVVWNHELQVVTPFTTDRAALKKGIDELSRRSNAGFIVKQSAENVKRRVYMLLDAAKSGAVTYRDAFAESMSACDLYAEDIVHDSERMLKALGRTTGTLAGLEGKKALVFAGAHMPERPGAELYMWTYNLFQPVMNTTNASNMQILASATTAQYPIEMALLHSANGGIGNMQRMNIKEAAREASSNGVTLYMIDAADSRDTVSAETASFADESEKFTTFVNTQNAYATLAKITGGVAISNTDNFDMAFRTVAEDLNAYYSLGYKPTEVSTGEQQRKIVVKLKNPIYRIRSRETYTQKTTDEQMGDRVLSNVFNTDAHGDWPVEIRAGSPQREGKHYRVPVSVSLAPTITLLPREKELVGAFTLYIAVGNAGGGLSDVTRNPRTLRIPVTAEQQLRSKPMTFDAVIMMSPGENTLSVGIIDQISSTMGFARTKIAAQ